MNEPQEHVLIAANPKSGAVSSRQRVSELRELLLESGYACDVLDSLDAVQRTTWDLHASGRLKAVVSAGGDGTADALANLLPSDVPLLIFPLGTENLLAKYLGMSGEVRQARDAIAFGEQLKMDVGSANGKLFLVMLSCGFDAEVVRLMHSVRTGHINRWSYARPILSSVASYRFPQLNIHTESSVDKLIMTPHNAAWLFVFNVPRYAAALDFCPQADPSDGLLDVCTFRGSGVARGLNYFLRLISRSHFRIRDFKHIRCERLTVAAPEDIRRGTLMEVPYQVDGDPGGMLPLDIQVLPARLTLLRAPLARG